MARSIHINPIDSALEPLEANSIIEDETILCAGHEKIQVADGEISVALRHWIWQTEVNIDLEDPTPYHLETHDWEALQSFTLADIDDYCRMLTQALLKMN